MISIATHLQEKQRPDSRAGLNSTPTAYPVCRVQGLKKGVGYRLERLLYPHKSARVDEERSITTGSAIHLLYMNNTISEKKGNYLLL